MTERHAHSEDAAFDALLDDARRHHISLAAAAKNALARHIPQSPAEPDTPLGGDTAHLPQGTVTLSDSRSGTASLGS
ncbi:hypothetical protein ACFTWF_24075 [Rhodococcus sp. NPDC056960]|uniref:hypothetical protein n=1 Tax=Rhodococcus sp. NPDC056960 TaxID=3345982 RepID=UPI00362A77B2